MRKLSTTSALLVSQQLPTASTRVLMRTASKNVRTAQVLLMSSNCRSSCDPHLFDSFEILRQPSMIPLARRRWSARPKT
jgi:hypothetical protein